MSMESEPEPALKSDSPIEEWAISAKNLSDICDTKRQVLLHQAISRTKWQKGLQIAAGTVALLSAMVGAARPSGMIALLGGTEFVAAALAFLSGIVSLVTTTLFEVRETHRMFEGAYQFLVVRDQLRTLYHRRGMLDVERFMKALEPLRAQYDQTTKEYEPMIEQ
jgi:hypothetical protein